MHHTEKIAKLMISLRNIPNEILSNLPPGPLAHHPIYEHGGIEVFLLYEKSKNRGIVYKRQGDQISGVYADSLYRFEKGKYFEIARNEGDEKPNIKVINPDLISSD